MIIYSSKLGAYVLANRPVGSRASARKVEGGYALVGWRSEDGEPPTLEQVEAWTPDPLTDVETGAKKMAERSQIREDLIFSPTSGLVGSCYAWLQRVCVVPNQQGTESKSPSAALAAGQALCSTYGGQLRRWIDFAAPDFYTSMSEPDADRPWLEWTPAGLDKSIRETILDKIYLATYGVARPA